MLQPGGSSAGVFLDIRGKVLFGGEQGLLGLTFHPQFSSNRRFFVNYTRRPDGATVVSEYRVSAGNPNAADPAETVLLVIAQPFANHNGGMIEFGHDGFLYIAMGDGGSGNDPGNRAQNVNDLLGKVLRIDVDNPAGGLPYSSPPDNPFVGAAAGRPEIFAYGLRNPFRFSFDRATGELYAGDVGQNAVEEIDIITRGGNYGWRIWEGSRCTNNDPGLCTTAGFIFPIAEYTHAGGRCAILGGHVYRGAAATLPAGSYVYGDLCTGEILLLQNGVQRVLLDTGLGISSFGEDEAGELYVVSLGGAVQRLVNVCAPGATNDPLCGSLRLSAAVNQAAFTVGQTLQASVGVRQPGAGRRAPPTCTSACSSPTRAWSPSPPPARPPSAAPPTSPASRRPGRISASPSPQRRPRRRSSSTSGPAPSSAASTRSSSSPFAPALSPTRSSPPTRFSAWPRRRSRSSRQAAEKGPSASLAALTGGGVACTMS